jgi:ribosomal protein S18 acetylase RimI-like enzyme
VRIEFEQVDRDEPIVRRLYADFIRETDEPLGIDLEPEVAGGPPAELVPPHRVLLLVRVDGEAAGLGGVRHLDTPVAEVKSMYIAPRFRRTGAARELLAELEGIAAARRCRAVRLDTSDYLDAAIALYRSAGYAEVDDYNRNPKANLWFERRLAGS